MVSKRLHKNQRQERSLSSIPEGLWEAKNIPCPPASREKSTAIFTRIRREESARFWQDHHKIPRNEYLNARTCPIKGVGGIQGLILETRLIEI